MEAYTEEVKGKMKIGKAIAERKHGEEERQNWQCLIQKV